MVTLKISQNLPAERNIPYNYAVTLIGLFELRAEVPEDKRERLVLVNSSSMLYSIAREVLRGAMASGPFMPVMLPTVSLSQTENTSSSGDSKKVKKTEQEDRPRKIRKKPPVVAKKTKKKGQKDTIPKKSSADRRKKSDEA